MDNDHTDLHVSLGKHDIQRMMDIDYTLGAIVITIMAYLIITEVIL